jgi:hypothetical protein
VKLAITLVKLHQPCPRPLKLIADQTSGEGFVCLPAASHHILNFFAKPNILLAQTLQPLRVVVDGANAERDRGWGP